MTRKHRIMKLAWLRLPLLAFPVLLVLGQQCARVRLENFEAVEFLSIGTNPYRLDPPVDYPQIRRVVFLVDMSQSMVSGPCIQDVDANIGFSTTPSYQTYDPNKGVGNRNDHRGSGIDCKVNPALPIARSAVINTQPDLQAPPPRFFETHLGNDHEANRIAVVRKWIEDSIAKNPESVVRQTKIMVIPVSGGISQKKLNESWSKITGKPSPIRFYDLKDPMLPQVLQWLKSEHESNLAISSSDDVWRYEMRTMGTSAPGSLLPQLFETVRDDMRDLNEKGLLSFADYQVIHLTDGLITPIKKNISDVLTLYGPCSSCASNPATCSATCGTLVQKMTDAWGSAGDNELSKIDFYIGLLQSLPAYFGAGFLRFDFVQLREDRLAAAYPGETTYFEKLRPYFEKRSARLSIWPSGSAEPPFRLVGDASKSTSYTVMNLFVLNTNARLDKQGVLKPDSDGDGLFDDEEGAAQTSPVNPRSNGYCLDSLLADPAFGERCQAMAKANSCDPSLDSDGDSLNECEEALLGTNPFDFDSDGDSIPDSLEWLYGYNPLVSDERLDSNGDGFLNLTNFSSGLGPQHEIKSLAPASYMSYDVNSKGKEKVRLEGIGEALVDLFEVVVRHVPSTPALDVDITALAPAFVARAGARKDSSSPNYIPYDQRLLSATPSGQRNTITVLARLIDKSNPERAYWRLYKTDIPLSNVYRQPTLDLSQLKMIRANDRNQ